MATDPIQHITVDPSDETLWTFDADAWCTAEGTTLSTATLTASATVTLTNEGAVASNAKTCRFTATAKGTIACLFTFADGQKRERTLHITVSEL